MNEPQLSAEMEKRFDEEWKDKIELKPFTDEEDAIYQKIMDKQVTYYPPRIKTVEELSRYLHVSPDRKLYLYPSPADDYKEWGNENHRKEFVQLVEAFLATALEEQREEMEKLINRRCFLQVIGSKQYHLVDADELRAKLVEMKEGK